MGKAIDIAGQKFGRLTVVSRINKDKRGNVVWLCRCNCGEEKVVVGYSLKRGKTKSCGCLNKEQCTTHGLTTNALYAVWVSMKQRCYNENEIGFKNYGGRGITMCDEWRNDFQKFYDWAIANGYEKGLSIDRIDNNRNYSPENCRWATRTEQNRNQRTNKQIEFNGEVKNLSEWCEHFSLNYQTVHARITDYGWTVQKALKTPICKTNAFNWREI